MSDPGARKLSGPKLLAPKTAPSAVKFEHYRRLVEEGGGQLSSERPTVLGLRGVDLEGNLHPTRFHPEYDDVFVVLRPDGELVELRGATRPSQTRSDQVPDVTGNGEGDVGMIRPGNYVAKPRGDYKGQPGFDLLTPDGSGRLPGWRDTDHDGRISERERRASEAANDALTSVLFHHGRPGDPASLGCATLEDYPAFLRAVGGPDALFDYTLVDAHRLGQPRAEVSADWLDDAKVHFHLGETELAITVHQRPGSDVTYLCVHDNEDTASGAARALIEARGGRLVDLTHRGTRLVEFELGGVTYTCDPNRIFTDHGAQLSLAKYGPTSPEAVTAARRFADVLLARFGFDRAKVVVTVHNNTPGRYSVKSYLPDGECANDAAALHINPARDPDDFLFVTERRAFDHFKAKGFNVVLQDPSAVTDDGSLSVVCARKGIPYLNVEAQHGHANEQLELLEAVDAYVRATA